MATHIVIAYEENINIDNGSYIIEWADKGNAMPTLPNTTHYVIWNNLPGQNEIQSKDASTGNMTGNTNLNTTSDAVGSTTIAALLTWAETRKDQIEAAETAFINAKNDDIDNGTTNAVGKTWRDYDPNYS
jgi:hypothetical protein